MIGDDRRQHASIEATVEKFSKSNSVSALHGGISSSDADPTAAECLGKPTSGVRQRHAYDDNDDDPNSSAHYLMGQYAAIYNKNGRIGIYNKEVGLKIVFFPSFLCLLSTSPLTGIAQFVFVLIQQHRNERLLLIVFFRSEEHVCGRKKFDIFVEKISPIRGFV
jgi:hypothetical protein